MVPKLGICVRASIDKESCPALFLKDVKDWQIQDPKGRSIEEVREIRNQVE